MRLKTAVLTTVLAGSLAGPTVVEASAATRHHSAKKSVAAVHGTSSKPASVPADDPTPTTGAIGVIDSIIQEIAFDLSGPNLQTVLWDLPGFGPY